jgi:hypothetical protein
MRQTISHRLKGNILHGLRRWEIRIPYLQADDLSPAGFERQDPVCHGNSWRLAQEVELKVEALHKVSF